jgi:hypothetical protein
MLIGIFAPQRNIMFKSNKIAQFFLEFLHSGKQRCINCHKKSIREGLPMSKRKPADVTYMIPNTVRPPTSDFGEAADNRQIKVRHRDAPDGFALTNLDKALARWLASSDGQENQATIAL